MAIPKIARGNIQDIRLRDPHAGEAQMRNNLIAVRHGLRKKLPGVEKDHGNGWVDVGRQGKQGDSFGAEG